MKDPVDHLLLGLYEKFNWGDPYGILENKDTMMIMEELDLHPKSYHARPLITYSNQECSMNFGCRYESLPENLFEILGEYRVKKYDQEGEIMIYEDCIQTFGLMYYEHFGKLMRKPRQYCVNLVREIVLWHELGHWITHWMIGNDQKRWNSRSFQFNNLSKDIHEGLAQSFVQYAIITHEDEQLRNDFQLLFHFLLINQEACYYRYNDLMRDPSFSWEKLMGGITMLRILENPDEVTFEYLLNNLIPVNH